MHVTVLKKNYFLTQKGPIYRSIKSKNVTYMSQITITFSKIVSRLHPRTPLCAAESLLVVLRILQISTSDLDGSS